MSGGNNHRNARKYLPLVASIKRALNQSAQWFKSPASNKPDTPARKVRFETLESRLLLNADISPVAQAGLLEGLESVQEITLELESFEELAQKLPLVDLSVSEGATPADVFKANILDPVKNYFATDATPTTDELVVALGGTLDGIIGDIFGDEIRFDVQHQEVQTRTAVPLGVDATANDWQLSFGADATVDLVGTLDLDFSFGYDLSTGLSSAEAFFIRVNDLSLSADVHTADLAASLNLGFVEASVAAGVLDIDADVSVMFANPDGDTKGNLTLAEIQGSSLGSLASLNTATASLTGSLPITVQLGSYNRSSTVTIDQSYVFDGAEPTVAVQGSYANELKDFTHASGETVLAALAEVGGWLGNLSQSSAQDTGLTLTDQQYKDVVDYGEAFKSKVLDAINSEGAPSFSNAQSLAQQLATAFGNTLQDIGLDYNSFNKRLSYNLSFDHTFLQQTTPIAFGMDLSPLGDLQASGQVSVDAQGSVSMTVAFDLSAFQAILTGALGLPADGILSGDAQFELLINNATLAAVAVARNTSNTSRNDLINDINAALEAAGVGTEVTASLDVDRLKLTGQGQLSGASLMVKTGVGDTAHTELGLGEDLTPVIAQHLGAEPLPYTGQLSGDAHVRVT
ncbi:MAG: LEPR-XLL domain-containing protein, partial [Gammaproteobacteria bacterium]